ncbi:hypothetical protein, partial [Morganella morganii]
MCIYLNLMILIKIIRGFISAEPQDAKIYVGLKKLFQDIQNELDQCWSVLGEIYGRYKEFSSLGINIRRIRSSLDDE